VIYNHIITHTKICFEFFSFLLHYSLESFELFATNRNWNITCPKETGNIWSISNDIPTFIRNDHLYQDISWEDVLFSFYCRAACSYRYAIIHRNKHIEDIVLERESFSTLQKCLSNILFRTRNYTDYVPFWLRIKIQKHDQKRLGNTIL